MRSAFLKLFHKLLAAMWLLTSTAAWTQDVIHHGPVLDIQVKRGEAQLPLALVDKLRKGDRLLVRPDTETLAKGHWVLLLARVSPTGNQVFSQHYEVSDLKSSAELEITADNQAPVIMLAPQLRNLFGLYTSLHESASLLNEVLRADPQRFFDLQKVDQINQAILAISQGLSKRVTGRKPQEAIQAARELATKFGVTNLQPDCIKNDSVNTECVATQIVFAKDFALPSNSDLSAMVGNKKAVDLNSFLLSNLRMFSEASDFLSNKYRDSYDFAPTFGRRQASSARIELFSVARFRSGNIKTAYIYVPSWFSSNAPVLSTNERAPQCFTAGTLPLQVRGKLPLVNYWHDWHMDVIDLQNDTSLGETNSISFDQESGTVIFEPITLELKNRPSSNVVGVKLTTRFSFTKVNLPTIRMRLPLIDPSEISKALTGKSTLISGEKGRLKIREVTSAACVRSMEMSLPDGSEAHNDSSELTSIEVDLSKTEPTQLTLSIQQAGIDPIAVDLHVLKPRARITSIEHAQWENHVTVIGSQLERIARVEVGSTACFAASDAATLPKPTELVLVCESEIRDNAKLPEQVLVVHRDGEPPEQRYKLIKKSAKPRFSISTTDNNSLVVSPSSKALTWNLAPTDQYLSEDSGLNALFQATAPYTLARGAYTLQIRFRDDPQSNHQPLNAPLIADFTHNELRTKNPISFTELNLPSVVNHLEYRIQHISSGQVSEWAILPRSVILLPNLQNATCSISNDSLLVSGNNLNLISSISIEDAEKDGDFQPTQLVSCPEGLCIKVPAPLLSNSIKIRMRWVDDRIFSVHIPKLEKPCGIGSSTPNRVQ
jgi:hypothetical protein